MLRKGGPYKLEAPLPILSICWPFRSQGKSKRWTEDIDVFEAAGPPELVDPLGRHDGGVPGRPQELVDGVLDTDVVVEVEHLPASCSINGQ